MAEEALEMSCGMKPEWARWSVHPGRETEETIEANLMFVRPQNIYPTPKAIKNESYCCTAAQKIPTKMPSMWQMDTEKMKLRKTPRMLPM